MFRLCGSKFLSFCFIYRLAQLVYSVMLRYYPNNLSNSSSPINSGRVLLHYFQGTFCLSTSQQTFSAPSIPEHDSLFRRTSVGRRPFHIKPPCHPRSLLPWSALFAVSENLKHVSTVPPAGHRTEEAIAGLPETGPGTELGTGESLLLSATPSSC